MPPYSALLDSETKILLAVSTSISGIVFVNECMSDTHHVAAVNYPNYVVSNIFRRGVFFIVSASPGKYPQWTWEPVGRKFTRTPSNLLTETIRTKSHLAVNKLDIIIRMVRSINTARNDMKTGLDLQETVYLTKKIQAQRFKDSVYDDNVIMEYPYVLQYADYARISLKEAADDILFKASLNDQHLANTELLRLRYFNKIREASEPEEVSDIYEEFIRDLYVNPRFV